MAICQTWRFPKIGVPLNHPFDVGIFHYKPSIRGTRIDGTPLHEFGWWSFCSLYNLGKTTIDHPFGNGLYHLDWGMVYGIVLPHITLDDVSRFFGNTSQLKSQSLMLRLVGDLAAMSKMKGSI